MVKVQTSGHEYYLDGYLQQNLDKIKDHIKLDWDYFLVIEGEERTGKSTLALQIGKYIDPNFSIDNIAFDGEQFREKLKNAKHGSVLIFDEAGTALFSRESQDELQRILVKAFMTMGVKNLFIVLLIPAFLFLDSYLRKQRGQSLIKVYYKKNANGVRERGYFRSYNKFGMRKIAMQRHYGGVNPSYWGRFTSYNPLPEYKAISTKWKLNFDIETTKDKKLKELDKKYFKTLKQRDKLILSLSKLGIQHAEIAQTVELERNSISRIIKAVPINQVEPILKAGDLMQQESKVVESQRDLLLTLMSRVPGVTVKDLVQTLHISRSAVQRIVDYVCPDVTLNILKRISQAEAVASGK